jgi:hypothetical protein
MSGTPLYQRWRRFAPAILLAAALCGEAARRVDSGPVPPCGGPTLSAYPDLDKPPTTMAWDRSGLGRDWAPPVCTGWTTSGFTSLVVTAALFRNSSGAESLVRRIGGISSLSGTLYWSTTNKRWQTLIVDSYALHGPTDNRRRGDFLPEEISTGKYLYFQQEDNLSGKAIYRLHIQSATRDRLVFDIENTTTVRYLLWSLFRPGELQSIYFLERESDEVWRFYSISRTGRKSSSLTAGHEASSINRAVAFYRYFTGIPTDQAPPASP